MAEVGSSQRSKPDREWWSLFKKEIWQTFSNPTVWPIGFEFGEAVNPEIILPSDNLSDLQSWWFGALQSYGVEVLWSRSDLTNQIVSHLWSHKSSCFTLNTPPFPRSGSFTGLHACDVPYLISNSLEISILRSRCLAFLQCGGQADSRSYTLESDSTCLWCAVLERKVCDHFQSIGC